MRITKVYTKGGDKGYTSLVNGQRVPKNHPRIASYGSVDELNSILGIIRTFLNHSTSADDVKTKLDTMLNKIQNHLFNVGADLATPPESRWEGMIRVGDKDVGWLETCIDELNKDLPELEEFILPGGGFVGSFFHQGRTVCRRAERDILTLIETDQKIDLGPLQYLNRLSDFLFVAGRWSAQSLNEKEYYWSRE